MSLFSLAKSLFNKRQPFPVSETEELIDQMINSLLKAYPLSRKQGIINEQLKSYKKLKYDEKLNKLPWIYLQLEKEILDNTASENISKEGLRAAICKDFPRLLKLKRFNLIFLPTKVQEVILCRTLLHNVMHRSLTVLGHFKDEFLIAVYAELDKPLDYIDENVDIHAQRKKLLNLSQDIFYKLKDALGENAVLNVYHSTYKQYFGSYYLLDAFTATLNIVPEDILNQEMIDLPSKHQMHKMLQQQVNSLEAINHRLTLEVVERKKVESSLKQNEILKTTILETAMDAIILIDEDYIVKDWNTQATTIFGWTKEEAIGSSIFKFASKEVSKGIEYRVKKFLKAFDPLFLNTRTEGKTNRKNGEEIDIEIAVNPIKTDNGYLFNAFARDITSRKLHDAEMKEAKEMAEKSTEAKSVFLSNMSHEIRTPLNVILGLTSILKENNNPDPELLKSNIEGIRFSSENLLAIVNDVLDFSTIEAGKITIDSVDFNIHQLVKNLKKGFEIKADEKGLEFEVIVDERIPQIIIGDQYRLNQILTNLLGNAIKFTSKGKVTLNISVCHQDTNNLDFKFEIKDTGVGIDDEQLNDIFGSFYQVHKPGKDKKEGTGLGLAITKQLVALQNGTLDVSSIVGIGSAFVVNLSFGQSSFQAIDTGTTTKKENETSLFGLEVLVAEDNKMNQFYIRQLLTNWDIIVTIANNGLEAVKLSKQHRYHAILMDLHMPEMDGYEATKAIRSLLPEIPIIACSADVFADSRNRAFEAGVNFYTTKPIREEEIKQLLINAIETSKIAPPKANNEHIEIETVKDILPKKMAYEHLNLTMLNETFDNNNEFIESVLHIFLEETPVDFQKLQEEVAKADFKEAGLTAHKVKSSFRTLGMTGAANILERIELKAKKNEHTQAIPTLLSELEIDYDKLLSEVRSYLKIQ